MFIKIENFFFFIFLLMMVILFCFRFLKIFVLCIVIFFVFFKELRCVFLIEVIIVIFCCIKLDIDFVLYEFKVLIEILRFKILGLESNLFMYKGIVN